MVFLQKTIVVEDKKAKNQRLTANIRVLKQENIVDCYQKKFK